jgi:hypothetical protein
MGNLCVKSRGRSESLLETSGMGEFKNPLALMKEVPVAQVGFVSVNGARKMISSFGPFSVFGWGLWW